MSLHNKRISKSLEVGLTIRLLINGIVIKAPSCANLPKYRNSISIQIRENRATIVAYNQWVQLRTPFRYTILRPDCIRFNTYLKLQDAPLFSHLVKALTPVLIIFTFSSLHCKMSLTILDV